MHPTMKKLLEELNYLASTKPPKHTTPTDRIFAKIRLWGFGSATAFLITMAFVGFVFPPSPVRNVTVELIAILVMVLPLLVMLSSIAESVLTLARWRKESFESLVRETDFDNECAMLLMKYETIELERTKQWIKGKLEKDSWRLSLFGTDKISVLATLGFVAAGWAAYEKVQAVPFLQSYHTEVFYPMAFFGGAILGSLLLRVSHRRFQKMQLWINLALFEKAQEKIPSSSTASTMRTLKVIPNRKILRARS